MDCQYDDSFILRYLNRELDTPSRRAFEHHLKLCSKCMLDLELCQSRLNSNRRAAAKTIEWAPFPGESVKTAAVGDNRDRRLDSAFIDDEIPKAGTVENPSMPDVGQTLSELDIPIPPKETPGGRGAAGLPPLEKPSEKAPQERTKALEVPNKTTLKGRVTSLLSHEEKNAGDTHEISVLPRGEKPMKPDAEASSLDMLRKLAEAGRAARKQAKPSPLPPALELGRKYGIPLVAILALLIILAMPSLSQPILGGLWSLTDKSPVQAVSEVGEEPDVLDFTGGFDDTDQKQLVAALNAKGMGVSPWQVLYADEEKVFIRNTFSVLRCQNGALAQAADLGALQLSSLEGSITTGFSFSPTGDYMLAGNNALEGYAAGNPPGVYLVETQTGRHAKISSGWLQELTFAWSFDGRYLAYAVDKDTQAVHVYDTETKKLTNVPLDDGVVKSLFISYSGMLSVFSGNAVATVSLENNNLTKDPLGFEPVFFDPDTRTVWYIHQGILKSRYLRNGTEKALLSDFISQDDAVTSYHMNGSHLVFGLKSGNAGILNLQSQKVKIFNLDGQGSGTELPWLDVSREGTRLLLDQDGGFIISNGNETSLLTLPDGATLSPSFTRWMDEESIVYVAMANPEEPAAGEFSVIRMSAATGKVSEWIRTTDQELETSNEPTIREIDLGPDEDSGTDDEVYEAVKATGNWVETLVLKTSPVRNGPSERYKESGEVPEGEILLYNNKAVNGWVLSKSFSGSSAPDMFWIRTDSLLQYNRSELPVGIITDESVTLPAITLHRGNMIRIIRNDGARSYVTADTIDVNAGITGWIDNTSYTTDSGRAYVNQSYLRSGSVIRTHATGDADPVPGSEGFTKTDQFVYLTDQRENGFVYITTAGGGPSGWVSEKDLYLPSSSEAPEVKEPTGKDLDGNGSDDETSFKTDGNAYILMVNNAMVGGKGESIRDKIRIIDIDARDSYLEIVVEEEGSGGVYQSTFYRYDGQNILLMGQLPGLCGSSLTLKGNGTVLALARGSLLETWYFHDTYRVNRQHTLVREPKDFYQKLMYEEALPLTLMIPSLNFRTSPGSEAVAFTLDFGEEVRFVGSDNIRWCQFENSTGQKGWLEISGFRDIPDAGGVPASDVFEGLSLAD